MQVILQRRAEVAFRSLELTDRQKVAAVLRHFEESKAKDLLEPNQASKFRKAPGSELYVMRATNRLRVVFSLQHDVLTVEDIVPHDRLGRVVQKGR